MQWRYNLHTHTAYSLIMSSESRTHSQADSDEVLYAHTISHTFYCPNIFHTIKFDLLIHSEKNTAFTDSTFAVTLSHPDDNSGCKGLRVVKSHTEKNK